MPETLATAGDYGDERKNRIVAMSGAENAEVGQVVAI